MLDISPVKSTLHCVSRPEWGCLVGGLPTDDYHGYEKADHDFYPVAWVCALDCELNAVRALLYEEDEALEPASHDENFYLLGRLEKHNFGVTSTIGYGTNAATQAVTNLIRSFPNVRVGLMVGVGGAVPREPDPANSKNDIRLGEIVVSTPQGNHDEQNILLQPHEFL
ncbi:hypothetical protein N7488_004738 [Penicillium malachiteum]|nr:hypothetical protein N7488_004738 [Penicillium malachiteum]